MSIGRVLIVDDHKRVLTALQILLQDEFEEVQTLSNPNSLLSTLATNQYDIILLDMNFSAGVNTGNEGLFWLKKILDKDTDLAVVLMTAYGDVELAVKAIKVGASDFILKPWDNNKLVSTLKTALELRRSKQKIIQLENEKAGLAREMNQASTQMIGRSKPMLEMLRIVEKVASTDANILILGEHGTGKELIARELHQKSERCNGIFITVDMGAITESLFESELFGHVKGAFTDARESRIGRFEIASGGTLFLDEIGNLSMPMQAKLLGALQTHKIIRLGDNQVRDIDIRLICATNKNLVQMVVDGEFREDLLYRINTIQIDVPELRYRNGDVAVLAEYYLRKYAAKYNKENLRFAKNTIDKLMGYSWPGNVRELQHTIEKAVILTDNPELLAEEFLFKERRINEIKNEAVSFEEMEKQLIGSSMDRHKGNMSHIAKELGVTRPTLYHKIKKYDL
ncbi:sigma-54-dependent transcriptional regulator [Labilibaculum antarcticum]|uniref:Sigma-54-dependent Fis family transcriptional regulator n=1 Tax=Labilibaculum antarcticum TaxID=1717717 RepID=A0A1Y1CLN2_9BACT|nr:sigma-54 dependent transcriptional regulator [Labilibaculum antarcticum]BAX81306.1 sigma-54-dependent Fis family transcriptional regulator [Labilibaculum antarcticum]